MDEDKLKTILKCKHGSENVDMLTYIDILKVLRDQVLNSTFVSISTKDREQANKIFEILNAKGKRLAHIDLIKNKIFEILKDKEPADFAEDRWERIKDVLNTGEETVGLATYYRHFWISKYKKTSSNKLYDDFNKLINKSEPVYRLFLNDMLDNAKIYMKIINPKREDYDNKKEYFWLVQSLNAMNNYFNVVQVRIALLALFDVKQKKIINLKAFKKVVTFLENFHFAYNAVCTIRANKLEKIYSNFAGDLRKCKSEAQANDIITKELIIPLNLLFPTFEEFSKNFIKLTYSKKGGASNVKTKYAINKLNCCLSNKEIFENDGSVEHLISEVEGEHALNIGNLILLEQHINNEAGQKSYIEKIPYYMKSDYMWIKKFAENHPIWEDSMIDGRAIEMSKIYYTKVFQKIICSKQI